MKRTRFYEAHRRAGAKFIEFFGWEMPLEYSGIVSEHLAVRERAGLFDVSHMGEIIISGPDALAFIQYLTPNDVSRLSPGQAQYNALTTPQGTFIDDLLVYCLDFNKYLLVVNAANTQKDYNWILDHKGSFDVIIDNASDRTSQLALQGPKAFEILQPLTDISLDELRPFWWQRGKVAGLDCLVSRTGYTGEDGFEIYTEAPDPVIIWDAIMEEGKPYGLLPAGLGARDNLRLEAKMMLYGNDIDETTTVLEADLKWIVKFNKGDFIGREALLKQQEEGLQRKIVGFELIDKGIARRHYPVYYRGKKVSEVTSGSYSPFLKKSIGLAYLPIEATEINTELEIGIREKKAKAKVVATPFYRRSK